MFAAGVDNINQVLKELYTQFDLELRKTKPDIKLKLSTAMEDSRSQIISDRTRIKQLLINLLSNAVKFTHSGFIEFGYHLKVDKKIVFFCRDTGIGISPENHHTIFERFRQSLDSEASNSYGGTGLGLSISKGILELMNGSIFVESEKGKGAHFWFELPYKINENLTVEKAVNKNEKSTSIWNNKTILIAEDEEFNYIYLQEILSETKANILRARDGNEAIQLFNQHPEIDLILMDLKMPIVNGLEATKQIKEKNKAIPIIAQTAYALYGDREKAIEMGCNNYLSKPIEKNKLFELLAKYLNE